MSFEKEKEQFPQKSITLAEYFATTYNKQVNKDLQCVELRGGQFVPIECLELLQGAAIPPTRLSASQASAMINVAAKPPAERLAAIQQIRQQSDFGPQSTAAQWGLDVEKDLLRLAGRVLPPPKVLYNQKSKTAAPNVRFGCVCPLQIPRSSPLVVLTLRGRHADVFITDEDTQRLEPDREQVPRPGYPLDALVRRRLCSAASHAASRRRRLLPATAAQAGRFAWCVLTLVSRSPLLAPFTKPWNRMWS